MTIACWSCGKAVDFGSKFCPECGIRLRNPDPAAASPASSTASTSLSSASRPVRPAVDLGAERRQLTILCCDLVASTSLAVRMDPEDLGEVIGDCLRLVAEITTAFDGYVARYVGDGVLVYFGYPHAEEDDAERALRAALRIVEAAPTLAFAEGYRPRFRIGVATGTVVVGDMIRSRGTTMADISGEPPFLATRLQAAAEPGTVVVSRETRRLTANRFSFRDLGPVPLKGFEAPRRAYQVLALSGVATQSEAEHAKGFGPLVGRDAEFAALDRQWQLAKQGDGQAAVVLGEAGIGKSRLATALGEHVGGQGHTVLRYYCSRQHEASPFHPIIAQIEQACGITEEDRRNRNLQKINRILIGRESEEGDLLLIADLLSMLPDDLAERLPAAPQRRREMTNQALLRLLRHFAMRRPTMMIFEDAHWSDPSSLELVDTLVRNLEGFPLFLIVTGRPEFKPRWSAPGLRQCVLGPLPPEDCAELMRSIAGEAPLAREVAETVVERSDGVPLFVEELTRSVLEAAREDPPARGSERAEAPGVPITLQASLTARLDRLGETKHVVQIAAALGREFAYDVLKAVVGPAEADIDASLARLVSAGLLARGSGASGTTYAFRHVLLQEAAHASMLRGTRRSLHARIVETLETGFPAFPETRPEILAYHAAEGGLVAKAAGYWLRAGKTAFARSAMLEAVAALNHGMALAERLPDTTQRRGLELDLCIALAKAHIATSGYTARSTYRAVSRARDLCERLGGPPQLPAVINGQWAYAFIGNELTSATHHAEEMLALGDAQDNRIARLLGHRAMGLACFARGEFVEARRCLEAGASYYRAEDQPIYAQFAVEDARVVTTTYLSWVLIYLGHFDPGRRARDQALAEARASGHALNLAHALNGYAFTELLLGSPDGALTSLRELEKVNEDHALSYYRPFVLIFRGLAQSQLGEWEKGLTLLEQGIQFYAASGSRVYETTFHRWLASSYRRAGRLDEAEEQLDRALSLATESGAFGDEGEIWRVRAEILIARGRPGDAEAAYRGALEVAERRQARLWTLRSATGLARLLERQGRSLEARSLLDETCAWFDGEYEPAELQAARSLLERVA